MQSSTSSVSTSPNVPVSFWELFNASSLVAGTAIGASMLAFPIATFELGFGPSLLLMGCCWVFMLLSGLLFMEALLWLEPGAHFTTLSEKLLGRWAVVVSWVLYPFIGYASIVAYISEGGAILSSLLTNSFEGQISPTIGALLFTLVFGTMLLIRKKIGLFNTFLMIALVLSYFLLVEEGFQAVLTSRLQTANYSLIFTGLPICLAMFSFHAIVPTLCRQLHYQAKPIRRAILFGTILPIIVYALWQFVVLGSVPIEGGYGLGMARTLGVSAGALIAKSSLNPSLTLSIEIFSLAALSTCFLGFSIGMVDFLADGIKKVFPNPKKHLLLLAVLLPALVIAIIYPGMLLKALDLSGAFGDAILNGLFPVLMVWRGRYQMGLSDSNRVWGGKIILTIVFVFFMIAIRTGLHF